MEDTPRKVEIFSKSTTGILMHVLHLISVVAIMFVVTSFKRADESHGAYDAAAFLVFGAGAFHLIYCLTFLFAPRFAIKGRLFWKTSPFLFSGLLVHVVPLLIKFRKMDPMLYWTLFPASLVLFVALYAGVYIRMDHPLVGILRPYVYARVDNPLSTGNSLETAPYGAPITVNNSFKGQPPVTMRFGSHAVVPGKI